MHSHEPHQDCTVYSASSPASLIGWGVLLVASLAAARLGRLGAVIAIRQAGVGVLIIVAVARTREGVDEVTA